MSRRLPASTLPVILAFVLIKNSLGAEGDTSNPVPPPVDTPSASFPPTLFTSNMPAPAAMQIVAPAATTTPPAAMIPPQGMPSQPGSRSSYSSVHVDGPYIAMTFDDGPHATLTPRLLDILKARHIHVTFFVLGQRVQEHPEIVERAIAEGHEVGNHTWDHLPLTKLAEGGLTHEIADTSALLKKVTGEVPVLLRPPYGATNPRLSRAIEKEYGMKVILWSVDPDDWKDPGSQVVEDRILSGWKESPGVKPGAIILSHDIHKGTVDAMPATLDALLAKGYKFVTVSELIAMEKKTPAPASSPSAVKSVGQ